MLFDYPWLLALLPLPLLIYWGLPALRQRARAVRIPFFELAAQATGAKVGQGSQVFGKPAWDWLVAGLIWLALVVAVAKPVQLGSPQTETLVSRDIMLAIDLSDSMGEVDFPASSGPPVQRLAAVKAVVSEYIAEREQDRVGLIVFGTRAYLQAPFTRDLNSVEQILAASTVSMAGPHTAAGDAIGLAIKHFESSEVEERLMILLTDGADTGSKMSPLNAAHIAADEGVRVFTIGIGDEQGEGQYRVDFDTLRQVAQLTDGAFYSATDSEALTQIYAEIDTLAATESESPQIRQKTALTHIPLIFALIMMLLAMLFRLFSQWLKRGATRA